MARKPLYPLLPDTLGLSSDDEDYTLGNGDDAPAAAHPGSLAGAGSSDCNHRSSRGQNKVHENSTAASGSGTLSLADFEKKYLNSRSRPRPSHSSRPSPAARRGVTGASVDTLAGLQNGLQWGYQWLAGASRWKIVFVGSVLGVLLAMLLGSGSGGARLRDGLQDNLLPCPPPKDGEPCIDATQLKAALTLALSIRDYLHTRAGLHACGGDTAVKSPNMTVEQLQRVFPKFTAAWHKPVFYLMVHNPHWRVSWVCPYTSEVVTDWTRPLTPNDSLFSTMPSVSLRCRAYLVAMELWMWVKFVPIVIAVIVAAVVLVQRFMQHRVQQRRDVFVMVEQILDILKQHHETSRRNKELLPFLAIIHVRDMLIPPSERDHKEWVWGKACHWIASRESRVRVEGRRVAGEEMDVWRWIQEDPPSAVEPASHAAQQRRNFWQGRAFEDYPPSIESKVAPPSGVPSPCIRLKNMFEPNKHMDDEQAREIENSVLDRCTVFGGVLHTFVDRKSPYGCVYIKMASVKATAGAYKALHGSWYKGKLVTAKYIPEAKYYKWFPHAAQTTKHLHPT